LSLDRRCHWEVYEESEKEKECKNWDSMDV
jgi:hypothetical protein